MTTAATENRQRSSVALRKELDRRMSSRENLEGEITSASEKLDKALQSGDHSASVRMQTRLSALQGLRDQEDRLIDRLGAELQEVESEEARLVARGRLPAIAREASEELAAFEAALAEINRFLAAALPKAIQHEDRVCALRMEFLAKAEEMSPGIVSRDEAGEAEQLVSEMEDDGTDLGAVLECRGTMPPTRLDRRTPRQALEPFGWLIQQAMDGIRRQEASAAAHREEE